MISQRPIVPTFRSPSHNQETCPSSTPPLHHILPARQPLAAASRSCAKSLRTRMVTKVTEATLVTWWARRIRTRRRARRGTEIRRWFLMALGRQKRSSKLARRRKKLEKSWTKKLNARGPSPSRVLRSRQRKRQKKLGTTRTFLPLKRRRRRAKSLPVKALLRAMKQTATSRLLLLIASRRRGASSPSSRGNLHAQTSRQRRNLSRHFQQLT